jgi:hypothetical protein
MFEAADFSVNADMLVKFGKKHYVMGLRIRLLCYSFLSVTMTRDSAQVQHGDKLRWQCVWLFTVTAVDRRKEITQKE